jgi:hypothetical protein
MSDQSEAGWDIYFLPDTDHFVRFREWSETPGIGVEFEAFDGVARSLHGPDGPYNPEWPDDVPITVYPKGYKGSGDDRPIDEMGFDAAYRVVFGLVKWDGCSHFRFAEPGDDGYVHLCGASEGRKLGELIGHCFQIAKEIYIKPASIEQHGDFDEGLFE